jgi:hypothetical protein
MQQKWKTPRSLRIWLDMPENAERIRQAIAKNIAVKMKARQKEAQKFTYAFSYKVCENVDDELTLCECCNKEHCNQVIAGCCSKCDIENMCMRCGYFNDAESEWYCEACYDEAIKCGEWLEGSDDEDTEN